MIYLTLHPNLSVTALVTAPTTEKARTTFLDYLERRGAIARADRSYWRRNMVAERMDNPEDVQADVELYYGYQEGGQTMPPSMTATPQYGSTPMTYEEPEEPYTEDPGRMEYEEEQHYKDSAPQPQAPVEEAPAPRGLSPIQQVSLGRSGK